MTPVPAIRVRTLDDRPPREAGRYVLYWMVASRRTHDNFALERAVELCRELRRPLLVLEALRCDYPWACERFHRFVLDGMADNAKRLERAGVRYFPYVEPEPGAGKGLLAALADHACAVVTDDFPAFMIPRMIEAAAAKARVRMEAVDSNGLLPLRASDKPFPTAYAFRRFLQRELPEHMDGFPAVDPLARTALPEPPTLPVEITRRWKEAPADLLAGGSVAPADLRFEADVPATNLRGGARAGQRRLREFLDRSLGRYAEDRNRPGEEVTSGLSPYLHFGHVSAHRVCRELLAREGWSPDQLGADARGSRTGWWGVGESAEAFLDQLVTWRELGFNMCLHRRDHDRYESLPAWALETLAVHAGDEREHVYSLARFEAAATHDALWNAAQRQLLREGRIHNYLRMLWGKKILHWTEGPELALEIMIELNNKYALDGRDPNSYSGIFWVLGRYDRPWGPERPVFGKVRYMTSANTARKFDVKPYLERYGPD